MNGTWGTTQLQCTPSHLLTAYTVTTLSLGSLSAPLKPTEATPKKCVRLLTPRIRSKGERPGRDVTGATSRTNFVDRFGLISPVRNRVCIHPFEKAIRKSINTANANHPCIFYTINPLQTQDRRSASKMTWTRNEAQLISNRTFPSTLAS
jgi:hypothetical protein